MEPVFRTYSSTHPWIKFSVEMKEASPHLWIMLGECLSKCEHLAGVPLRPDTAEMLHQVYLIKGALATTAIEGNTLTEEELTGHRDGSKKLPPSREYLAKEVGNIIDACNGMLDELVAGDTFDISPSRLDELNAAVLSGLALPPEVQPGQLRRYSVGVGRYKGAPHEDCAHLVERLCEWLRSKDFEPAPGLEIPYAILKAVVAHLYFAWIHPYGDGNGRTARLLEFQILISSGVPAPAAQLLSNHYNQTRSEYYRHLDESSKAVGNVLGFINYAVRGMVDGLREQINRIRDQQFDITWRNFVHESFRTRKGESDRRRRQLILDLSRKGGPVTFSELNQVSPAVAAAYARKTRTTLSRDVNVLREMELIIKNENGYSANREQIKAFMPRVAAIRPHAPHRRSTDK